MFRDGHIHFILNGKAADRQELLNLRDTLINHGITEVYDMGNRGMTGLEAREVFRGSIGVKTCGAGLYKKGGYGKFLGLGVSDIDEIKRVINELSLKKVDFIKVMNSGIVSLNAPGLVTEGGFSREELAAICNEAGERNLPVFAHANSDKSIRDAVEAGVSSIEHGFFITSETIDIMKERAVSWTPTVFALTVAMSEKITGVDSKVLAEIIEGHLESINYAASIGLRLRIGTDSGSRGVRHGESFMKEVEFFKRAGLSDEQINAAGKFSLDKILKEEYINPKCR